MLLELDLVIPSGHDLQFLNAFRRQEVWQLPFLRSNGYDLLPWGSTQAKVSICRRMELGCNRLSIAPRQVHSHSSTRAETLEGPCFPGLRQRGKEIDLARWRFKFGIKQHANHP